MTREELTLVFEQAKKSKSDIYIAVTIPGQNDVEYVVNKYRNLDNRLEYYCHIYDENGQRYLNKQVRIVDAGCINFYIGE